MKQHYSRLHGTLLFWKKKASQYRRFHFYCLLWTIPSAVVLPTVTMAIAEKNSSRLFATLISGVTAVLLAFHRGLKVEDNYKSFRHGESEFYDLYRRLLDRPTTLGQSQLEQLDAYFKEVEVIRRFVRSAETDNLATLDEARAKLSANKAPIKAPKAPASQQGGANNAGSR
ncbi:MAG TPA: hypothetical protein VHR45_11320 [Thermoanaerobaculia bacterium]|nr:hypothetical protein [Thermoanaerobaculia bacterium]